MSSSRLPASLAAGRLWWVATTAAICAAVWLAYAGGLAAPFIMDDFLSIHANRSIRKLWPLWPVLYYPPGDGWTRDARPLLNLSLAVNRAVTGMSPLGFRAVNIVIHCCNAILLMALASQLLATPAVPASVRGRAREIAFTAALLWAVHPLCTGAVTYIIQRAESLAALLILGTVVVAVRGMSSPGNSPRLVAAVAALSVLAGTAKETAVVIPLVTVLIDRALLAGSWPGVARHWHWHLAAAASWPSVVAMLAAWGGRGTSAGVWSGVSPWLYLLTQAKAIWLYGFRIIAPWTVVFDHGEFVATGIAEAWPWLALTGLSFFGVVYGFARDPVVWLAPLLFFVLLGPTSSIIPVKTQTIAEHRAYLASAALVVLFVAMAWAVTRRYPALSPRVCRLTAAALGLALGLFTAACNRDFARPELLWRKALAAEPRNVRAMSNLARELISKRDAESLAEAERLLATAAASGHRCETLLFNTAALAKARGRPLEALSALTAALALLPQDAHGWADRGYLLWKTGRLDDALTDLDRAVALDTDMPAAWLNRGNVLLDLGRASEAERSFTRAVEIDPQYAVGWDHLGIALHARGDRDAALAAFDRAVACGPDSAAAFYNRGRLFAETGRSEAAIADFTAALARQPSLRDAHYNRAVVRLRLRRMADARADIEAFERLGGTVPPTIASQLQNPLP